MNAFISFFIMTMVANANEVTKIHTNKESIIKILGQVDSLRNDILAKSLVEPSMGPIDRIITIKNGEEWGLTGLNCNLTVMAYSKARRVSETKLKFGDEGCPNL